MKHEFMIQTEQVRGELTARWVFCLPCGNSCPILKADDVDNDFRGPWSIRKVEAYRDLLIVRAEDAG